MEFIPAAVLAALVWKVIDWLKVTRQGDWNASLTQLTAWAAGVVVIFLVAQTDFANAISFGGVELSAANGWTKLFVGLEFASAASVGVDFKKAIDGTDSAKMPNLFE